jgi:hypothetical protein
MKWYQIDAEKMFQKPETSEKGQSGFEADKRLEQ